MILAQTTDATSQLPPPPPPPAAPDDVSTAVKVAGFAILGLWLGSGAISAYHGYKRNNDSLGWGLGWGLMGLVFPILSPTLAIAEGYAEPLRETGYGRRILAGPKRRRIYRRRAA